MPRQITMQGDTITIPLADNEYLALLGAYGQWWNEGLVGRRHSFQRRNVRGLYVKMGRRPARFVPYHKAVRA